MPRSMTDVYDHALKLWGMPYVWGGNFTPPASGGDCSALIINILTYGKAIPDKDTTAHGLYLLLKKSGEDGIRRTGSIAFFGDPTHIKHCGWMIDSRVMLNAAGGTQLCTTPFIAQKLGASVKIEPISRRSDLVAVIFPKYRFDA